MKPSTLKREHPALQNMKFIYFFLLLWSILSSWTQNRISNTDLIESGSNPDPDPKPCLSGRVADPVPHQSEKLDLAEWLERLTVPLPKLQTVLRIRIRRTRMFLGLPDPDQDPLVRGTDPDPDPSIIKQK
jgi:hypothetical protein